MTAVVLRGDAAHLPLPDGSVDLIVTSPPYWALRSYSDNGEHYEGQIGSEETPQEYLEALWRCTAEWMRVLKPEGSMFVDLGDKYDSGTTTARVNPGTVKDGTGQGWNQGTPRVSTGRPKSLLLLPERYRIGCVDRLGLTAREVIEWHKPNPLPESAHDRCGRTHEDVTHFVKQERYYAAVDEIREPHSAPGRQAGTNAFRARNVSIARTSTGDYGGQNPLGKVPGSVWRIPSAPLSVPDRVAHGRCCAGRKRPGCQDGLAHYAAYPPALMTPIILGWSPSGICLECGEGRRPVVHRPAVGGFIPDPSDRRAGFSANGPERNRRYRESLVRGDVTAITGYACACTPYTDHPGTGERYFTENPGGGSRGPNVSGVRIPHVARGDDGPVPRVGPWREYHFDHRTPPPTRPAVVVDPFGGTGTTALVADVLGRIGITVDRSADYCRLAHWRTRDPGERARALGVPKPPPVPEGQASLFDEAS